MSEIVEPSNEIVIAPEIPRGDWQTLLWIQRHGRYIAKWPDDMENLSTEDAATLGHLTPEGRAEAAQVDDQRLAAIFEQTDHPSQVDFLLLNSPTFWLDDTRLGQRARETAEILANRVLVALQQRGLPEDQLLNTQEFSSAPNRQTRFKGDQLSRPEERIQEGQMFQFQEYTAHMRKKYKGQGPAFWDARNADNDPEDQAIRERVGAPSPIDDAREISDTMVMAYRFARAYHNEEAHPENRDRRLVVLMVSHGDGLWPYVQRVVGAPKGDFTASYNEGVGITIDGQNQANALVAGKQYPMEFPDSGRDVHIRSNEEMV